MSAYPESVYEFGAWLKAHPWVKRVRLDVDTFERYVFEVSADARSSDPNEPLHPILTWRMKVAMIRADAWYRREALFPSTRWRHA